MSDIEMIIDEEENKEEDTDVIHVLSLISECILDDSKQLIIPSRRQEVVYQFQSEIPETFKITEDDCQNPSLLFVYNALHPWGVFVDLLWQMRHRLVRETKEYTTFVEDNIDPIFVGYCMCPCCE